MEGGVGAVGEGAATITTAYFNSAVYKTVDTYTLGQSFSTQGDPELLLGTIVRKAFAADGTSITLPTVSFGNTLMDNRVHGYNNQPAMAHWRLTQIITETGETIVVKYSGDDSQTGRVKPLCTPTTVPTDPSQDTSECFPVYWTPPFNTDPILDYFHKYVVTEVDVDEPHAIAPDRYTTYTYLGRPAWHFDDNEVVKPANRTYGQFRGYAQVETRTGNQNVASGGHADRWTLSRATYYRGMDGDKLPSGTRSATVTGSLGETVADNNLYADTAREVRTFNGTGGDQVSTTITTVDTLDTTATRARTGLPALTANITAVATKRAYTNLAAGGTRSTTTSYGYDSLGRLVHQTDTGTGVAPLCTTTSYADNTSTWIRNRVSEKITSAQTCPASGDPSPILSDSRSYYDGSTTLGAVPEAGDATRVDTATDNTAGTTHWAKTTASYDTSGRPAATTAYTSASDTSGRTTRTTYTPADGGPLTKTVTTNPAEQTSTTLLDAGRGVITETVDVAGHKTDAAYDALGRVIAVWQPGQTKPASGTSGATTTYTYLLRNSGPLAVTTKTLIDPGNGTATSYKTSISLYDAFGTLRQTQTDAVGGGRVITDSYTDSHGWVVTTNNRWYTAGTPATTIITTADSGIDSRTTTDHDDTGRPTVVTEYQGTTPKWSTKAVYGGDRTTVVPPDGGIETTTVTDARGHTTELDQWTSPPTITGNTISGGTADKTTYHYTPLGQQDRMTTASGTPLAATWTSTYDLAGRVVAKTDPDTGATTSTYDDTGELATSTDARGQTLAYSYDNLGRKLGEYSGSTSGTQLASWTYDTLQAGQLTSSTRHAADGDYTVAATGYDAVGNPTGTKTSLPASLTALGYAVSYTTSYTWTTTHLMATKVTPSGGGLPGETITSWYDSFGDPNGSTGVNAYVSAALYSPYGEPNQYTLGVNNQTSWLTFSRDGIGRITKANLSSQTAIPQLENLDYTYDPAGNITRAIDTQGGGPNVPVETHCYTYNSLDELTTAWSGTDSCAATPTSTDTSMVGGAQPYWTSWTVDAAGSRTGQTQHALAGGADTVTTYTPGVAGHAHALATTSTTSGASASSTSYSYDAAGNTTTRTGVTGGDQTLDWNEEGRLAAIHSPAGDISYTYDADGTQLVRRDPDSTTLFLPGEELTRNNTTGTITGTRYYTHNGAVVGERVGGSNPYYLFSDPHGTVQTVVPTDPAGTETPIRRYLDPYGNPLADTTGGTWPDQHGYLGKPQNPTTGLVDVGARTYDPVTGRFLSVDPILDPADPQSANGYTYTDNPIVSSDPTGTMPQPGMGECSAGHDCDTNASADPNAPGSGTGSNTANGYGTAWWNDPVDWGNDALHGPAVVIHFTRIELYDMPVSSHVVQVVADNGGVLQQVTRAVSDVTGGAVNFATDTVCASTSKSQCRNYKALSDGYNGWIGADPSSGWYKGGYWTGLAASLAIPGGAAEEAIGARILSGASRAGTRAARTAGTVLRPSSLADEVAKATGGVLKTNKAGYTVEIPNGSRGITVRVMERGGARTNYYRVSVPGKATYTVGGEASTDAALTHIDIGATSLDDILSVINRIQGGG